jgi:hypothetical protein
MCEVRRQRQTSKLQSAAKRVGRKRLRDGHPKMSGKEIEGTRVSNRNILMGTEWMHDDNTTRR